MSIKAVVDKVGGLLADSVSETVVTGSVVLACVIFSFRGCCEVEVFSFE